jgi:hypothetical protein
MDDCLSTELFRVLCFDSRNAGNRGPTSAPNATRPQARDTCHGLSLFGLHKCDVVNIHNECGESAPASQLQRNPERVVERTWITLIVTGLQGLDVSRKIKMIEGSADQEPCSLDLGRVLKVRWRLTRLDVTGL